MRNEINTATTNAVITNDGYSFYEFGGLYLAYGSFKTKKGKAEIEQILNSGLGWVETTEKLIRVKGATFETRIAN